jgi:hypothetical protein
MLAEHLPASGGGRDRGQLNQFFAGIGQNRRMSVRITVPLADEGEARKKPWSDLFQPHDRKIENVVAQHLPALARKRLQLLTRNEYGKHQKKGWEREVSYFLSEVLIPGMPWWHPLKKNPPAVRELTKAAKIVERLAAAECTRIWAQTEDRTLPEDGLGYEQFCRRILEANGWKVEVTKNSGDQGADLVALRGNIRVALQCKRYSRPVGNKAVQEIAAGRNFYRTDFAAVVTNGTTRRLHALSRQPIESCCCIIRI